MTSPWDDEGARGGTPGGGPAPGAPWAAPQGGSDPLGGPPPPSGGEAGPRGHPWGAPVPWVAPPSPERPRLLTSAVDLMWIGAGLALLNVLSTFLFVDDIREAARDQLTASGQRVTDSTVDAAVAIGIAAAVAGGLVTIGLWIWMAVMNGKGRSWARVVATVLGAIGMLFSVLGLAGSGFGAETTPISLASSGINLLLAVAILVLLWNSQNAEYYRAGST